MNLTQRHSDREDGTWVGTPAESAPVEPTGVAPADEGGRRKWPKWKVALAYLVMLGVAVWSIWMIDSHVLRVAAEQGGR